MSNFLADDFYDFRFLKMPVFERFLIWNHNNSNKTCAQKQPQITLNSDSRLEIKYLYSEFFGVRLLYINHFSATDTKFTTTFLPRACHFRGCHVFNKYINQTHIIFTDDLNLLVWLCSRKIEKKIRKRFRCPDPSPPCEDARDPRPRIVFCFLNNLLN